jgi:hypothetical protein
MLRERSTPAVARRVRWAVKRAGPGAYNRRRCHVDKVGPQAQLGNTVRYRSVIGLERLGHLELLRPRLLQRLNSPSRHR